MQNNEIKDTDTTNINVIEENKRSLATIMKVEKLYPIAGADRIVLAQIQGWTCIVKKDEFKEGDLGVYISIDSIPDFSDPNFEFLKGKCDRIKTMKMRKVISQGLFMPLDILTSRIDSQFDKSKFVEGFDVTNIMGITKYVSDDEKDQYFMPGATINNCEKIPPYVQKTDEPRIQQNKNLLNILSGRNIIVTRKEDGCSATYIYYKNEFKLCGRNFVWKEEDQSNKHYYEIIRKFDIQNKMIELNQNIAIQGEITGPKINKNRLMLDEYNFSVFNIWSIDQQKYLLHDDMENICSKLGLNMVPILYKGNADKYLPELTVGSLLDVANKLEYAKGKPAEGIVVKTTDDLGERISFKVISNNYLLKHDI